MKKALATLFVITVTTLLFACKGHEKCPAYGKTDVKVETPA